MEKNNSKIIALRVAYITIIVNFALCAFKLTAGILGKSSAMVSDAIHSASDVVSTIIVIIGVIIASKPIDDKHQYGHERLECVASLLLAVLLTGTGVFIGVSGIQSLISGSYKTISTPSLIALIAAITSIAVKEAMFWFAYICAKKINSLSLKADAWHHRSDALSSIGSLIGIGGAMLFNLPILDVIASLVICVFIVKIGISVFIESVNRLIDKSCPETMIEEMKNLLYNIDGVLSVDEIKTRMFGNKIFVDVEIGAYENLPLKEAHGIAEIAHSVIENYNANIKHCMVHVNPVSLIRKEEEIKLDILDEEENEK